MSEKKKNRFKSTMEFLLKPVSIGIYLAIVFCLLIAKHYQIQTITDESSGIFGILSDVDKKSTDYRLRLRGPRPGSPHVAILAVDDKSVNTVGRWPWPRELVARALENTVKNGAKVIAADVTFSEPSFRSEVKLYETVKDNPALPKAIRTELEFQLELLDSDKRLAETIERIQDSFILGNFFEGSSMPMTDKYPGYVAACHQIVFEGTSAFKIWNSDQMLMAATDANELPVPDVIKDAYKTFLSMIAADVKEKFPNANEPSQQHALNADILRRQHNFCAKEFFQFEKDPLFEDLSGLWDQVLAASPEIKSPTYRDWISDYTSRYKKLIIPETDAWTMNTQFLSEKGLHNGYFNAILDSDGVIRRSQLIGRTGTTLMPSIALKAFLMSEGVNPDLRIDKYGPNPNFKGIAEFLFRSNETGDVVGKIPVSEDGKVLINYAGGAHMFAHVSISDMLDESNDKMFVLQKVKDPQTGNWMDNDRIEVSKKEFLKDKVLIFGATAIGVYDLRVTPFDENFPGVETHANVADNLIRRDFLLHHAKEGHFMPLAMVAIGILLAFSLSHLGALYGLGITFLLAAAVLWIDKTFLFEKGILVSVGFPLIQILSTYLVMTFYKYFTEERAKKELRSTFSKYVSPQIVAEILADPKNLELGGRKEHITVFFSDVRGFTTIAEKLDPRALSDLLNSYLTPMTDLVFKNQGTLDKYMGDALMAFFGAPISYQNHAHHACRCALQNLEKLAELVEVYKQKGLPLIDIGIGLNTGDCSVGNMGSETVRSYTVMGDAVNLASRLEGINKTYGTKIIISENTYGEAKDKFFCREVDWVRVKGKKEPVKIYELISEGNPKDLILESTSVFGEGYKRYHEKRFQDAIREFEKAISINVNDETSKIYIERCQEFIIEPPAPDWDGVYVMKTK